MNCPVKIVILCAIQKEYQANMSVMKHTFSFKEYLIGKIGGVTCALHRTGIGALAAQRAALDAIRRFRPKIIFYSGIAGSRNPNIKIGQVVVSGFVCDKNAMYFSPSDEVSKYHAVELRRGDKFLDRVIIPGHKKLCKRASRYGAIIGIIGSSSFYTANQKWLESLNEVYHTDAGENEGIGFAYAAITHEVPFMIIRGISDSVYQQNASSEELGAKNAAELLSKIITKSIFTHLEKRIKIKDLSPESIMKTNGYTEITNNVFMRPPQVIKS